MKKKNSIKAPMDTATERKVAVLRKQGATEEQIQRALEIEKRMEERANDYHAKQAEEQARRAAIHAKELEQRAAEQAKRDAEYAEELRKKEIEKQAEESLAMKVAAVKKELEQRLGLSFHAPGAQNTTSVRAAAPPVEPQTDTQILLGAINAHYRKLELEFFAERVIYPLLEKSPDLLEEFGDFHIFLERKLRTKEKYVILLTAVLLSEKLFTALLAVLGDDVRQLLERLLYDEFEVSIVKLSDSYKNGSVVTRSVKERLDNVGLRPVQAAYMLFATTSPEMVWLANNQRDFDFLLYLPDEVRICLRRYFPVKPEYIELLELSEAPKGKYHYSNEAAIVQSASMLANMIDENLIDYDTKGEKPLKSALKKLQSLCGFQEFFALGVSRGEKQMKNAEYLATELLINIASQDDRELEINKNEPETVAFVRLWLRGLCGKPQISFSPLKDIVTHVKEQYSSYQSYKEIFLGAEFYSLLSSLPANAAWIGADNLVKKTLFKPASFQPLSKKDAEQTFYVTPASVVNQPRFAADRKFIDSSSSYQRYISEPLVKGAMFLFAAMGLVEILYDDAVSSTPLNNNVYLSPYDSLKAVRITALGNYLLGRSSAYTTPAAVATKQGGTLLLDEYRLLATLSSANPLLEVILLDFMRPVGKMGVATNTEKGSRLYVMDSASFLKNCSTEDDVYDKIHTFKKRVAASVPAIWEAFFEEILGKIEPLEEQFEYRVFTIKPNRDLMRLLSTDIMLKDFVLRAEGHRILIKEDDIPLVKKRLEKYGYLTALEKRKYGKLTSSRRGNW